MAGGGVRIPSQTTNVLERVDDAARPGRLVNVYGTRGDKAFGEKTPSWRSSKEDGSVIGKKVVVADDEPHIRHVLALKLTKAGLDVQTAGDGEEALDLCLAERPDLLITDYQMPVMSGLELCKELRATPATRGLPAIMLTARGFDLGPDDTAQTNIAALMSKPFGPAEVLEKVESLLNRDEASLEGS